MWEYADTAESAADAADDFEDTLDEIRAEREEHADDDREQAYNFYPSVSAFFVAEGDFEENLDDDPYADLNNDYDREDRA